MYKDEKNYSYGPLLSSNRPREKRGGGHALKAGEVRVLLVVTENVFVTPLPNITAVAIRSTHSC